jgi:hypothetical protein
MEYKQAFRPEMRVAEWRSFKTRSLDWNTYVELPAIRQFDNNLGRGFEGLSHRKGNATSQRGL